MEKPSTRLLARIIAHSAAGALLGYGVLHPVSMLIVTGPDTARGAWWGLVQSSFGTRHLPMALYFAALSCIAGGLQGAYVHRLRELYERVRELSRTDALTSLGNRRRLFERFERELERAAGGHADLALLMIDVDHFKRLNDEHGHLVGDGVLRELAAVIRGHVRPADVVARYGGEEFIVLGPGIGQAEAEALAERLREATAGHAFDARARERPFRVTISIGVATFPAAGESAEALIAAADAQLYAAKRAGRNSVRPMAHGRHAGCMGSQKE